MKRGEKFYLHTEVDGHVFSYCGDYSFSISVSSLRIKEEKQEKKKLTKVKSEMRRKTLSYL